MKLFINHLDTDNVKKYLTQLGLKDFDFSLFVDKTPESHQDLSPINIFVLQEPNEYFNLHNWVIANQELFWLRQKLINPQVNITANIKLTK